MNCYKLAICLFCFSLGPLQAQERPDSAILEVILAQRKLIPHGHVYAESQYTEFASRGRTHSECDCWFNGSALRIDRRFMNRENKLEEMVNSVCLFGFEKFHVHYGIGVDKHGLVTIADPTKITSEEGLWKIPDPRFLGLVPETFATTGYVNVEKFLAANETGCKVEETDDVYEGHKLSKLVFVNANHGVVTIKFIKELNYAVRSTRYVDKTGLYINESVSELKEVPNQSIWYPTSVAFASTVNNAPSTAEQLRVKFDFSTKLDDKTFSIPGMEFVKPGTQVNWKGPIREDKMPPLVWDGKDIIHVERNDKKDEKSLGSGDSESTNQASMLFITGACLLGVGAAVILWQSRRKIEAAVK